MTIGRSCQPPPPSTRIQFSAPTPSLSSPIASDTDDESSPALGEWHFGEPAIDSGHDLGELVVRERPDQDHAGVLAASLGPALAERSEVSTVPGHQNASVAGGKLEHRFVVERLQVPLLGDPAHIVTALGERLADPLRREVCVKQ